MTDERWREVQRFVAAVSAGPASFARATLHLVEKGAWREFVHPMHGVKRYDSFGDFCREWAELEPEKVLDVVEAAHGLSYLDDAVTELRRLVRDGTPELVVRSRGEAGRGRPVSDRSSITTSRGDDYVIGRLKRDDPALAAEVIEGRITPHAAALKAGIRKPRATFVTDDVDRAVDALLRHYSRDDVQAALTRRDA